MFIYHSTGESAVTGIAEVSGGPRPDPDDAKSYVVELTYVAHLNPPVPLREIKESEMFSDWALVRQSRLSTMAAPDSFVSWMRSRYPEVRI